MSSDEQEKSFDPTPKRLEDARKRGEFPRSQEIGTALAYLGILLLSASFLPRLLGDLGKLFSGFLIEPNWPAQSSFFEILTLIAPIFLILIVVALVGQVAQRAFVFVPTKLEPKLSRISLLSNAKQKFGPDGLFEFGKSGLKLLLLGTVISVLFLSQSLELPSLVRMSSKQSLLYLNDLTIKFLIVVVIVSALIACADYFWQLQSHLRKNRMSRQEIMDEQKDSEGDPAMKGRRRQKAVDIALNSMLKDAEDADVIIVNPTHFAVALKWDQSSGRAPICLAKGVDEIAAQIRRVAQEQGVPVRSDPPTARALYATVSLGEEVPPEHYRAVAAAIRFAENIRKKAKAK